MTIFVSKSTRLFHVSVFEPTHQRFFLTSYWSSSFKNRLKALQMGTCVATCTAWFCCSTISSLLSSCCGNDKSSTTPAGPTSGRKRSVFLLFTSVCLQFVFQFGLAPYILDHLSSDNAIRKSWLDGCELYNVSSTPTANATSTLQQSCAGNTGTYRVAATTTLFFTLGALIAAFCKPTANREAWPLKIILYLALLAGTIIVPNDPIFTPIYRSIATGKFIWNNLTSLEYLLSVLFY
jgi:Serine incorporator (Serinc)